MNGPARPGDVYRFDRYGRNLDDPNQVEHFPINAVDDAAAVDEAEYLLNPENAAVPDVMTGKLWRVDGPCDVLVAGVGPLDFGRAG